MRSGNYERLYFALFCLIVSLIWQIVAALWAGEVAVTRIFFHSPSFNGNHNHTTNMEMQGKSSLTHFLFRFPHFTRRCFFTFLLRVFFSISGIFPFSWAIHFHLAFRSTTLISFEISRDTRTFPINLFCTACFRLRRVEEVLDFFEWIMLQSFKLTLNFSVSKLDCIIEISDASHLCIRLATQIDRKNKIFNSSFESL